MTTKMERQWRFTSLFILLLLQLSSHVHITRASTFENNAEFAKTCQTALLSDPNGDELIKDDELAEYIGTLCVTTNNCNPNIQFQSLPFAVQIIFYQSTCSNVVPVNMAMNCPGVSDGGAGNAAIYLGSPPVDGVTNTQVLVFCQDIYQTLVDFNFISEGSGNPGGQGVPSFRPSNYAQPDQEPTPSPIATVATPPPTKTPTKTPTKAPTKTPTKAPTKAPTKTPTKAPTNAPITPAPTASPTQAPSRAPIVGTYPPTQSSKPTTDPTSTPTLVPSTATTVVEAPSAAPDHDEDDGQPSPYPTVSTFPPDDNTATPSVSVPVATAYPSLPPGPRSVGVAFYYQLALAEEISVEDIANPNGNTIREDLINAITAILEPVLNARHRYTRRTRKLQDRTDLDTVTFDSISRGSLPDKPCGSSYCIVVTSTIFIFTTEREDSVKLATYGIMQSSMEPASTEFVKLVNNELVLSVVYGDEGAVPSDVCLYDCLEEDTGLNTIEIALISICACAAVLAYPVYLVSMRTRRSRKNAKEFSQQDKEASLPVAGHPFLMGDDFENKYNTGGSGVETFSVYDDEEDPVVSSLPRHELQQPVIGANSIQFNPVDGDGLAPLNSAPRSQQPPAIGTFSQSLSSSASFQDTKEKIEYAIASGDWTAVNSLAHKITGVDASKSLSVSEQGSALSPGGGYVGRSISPLSSLHSRSVSSSGDSIGSRSSSSGSELVGDVAIMLNRIKSTYGPGVGTSTVNNATNVNAPNLTMQTMQSTFTLNGSTVTAAAPGDTRMIDNTTAATGAGAGVALRMTTTSGDEITDDDYSNSVNSEYAALMAKVKGVEGNQYDNEAQNYVTATSASMRVAENNTGTSLLPRTTPAVTKEQLGSISISNEEHATAFKSQVVDLLSKIAPEDVSGADEMIGQFEGREYALLETLQMMLDRRQGENVNAAIIPNSSSVSAANNSKNSKINVRGFEDFSDDDEEEELNLIKNVAADGDDDEEDSIGYGVVGGAGAKNNKVKLAMAVDAMSMSRQSDGEWSAPPPPYTTSKYAAADDDDDDEEQNSNASEGYGIVADGTPPSASAASRSKSSYLLDEVDDAILRGDWDAVRASATLIPQAKITGHRMTAYPRHNNMGGSISGVSVDTGKRSSSSIGDISSAANSMTADDQRRAAELEQQFNAEDWSNLLKSAREFGDEEFGSQRVGSRRGGIRQSVGSQEIGAAVQRANTSANTNDNAASPNNGDRDGCVEDDGDLVAMEWAIRKGLTNLEMKD